jgi:hypothetical protein
MVLIITMVIENRPEQLRVKPQSSKHAFCPRLVVAPGLHRVETHLVKEIKAIRASSRKNAHR